MTFTFIFVAGVVSSFSNFSCDLASSFAVILPSFSLCDFASSFRERLSSASTIAKYFFYNKREKKRESRVRSYLMVISWLRIINSIEETMTLLFPTNLVTLKSCPSLENTYFLFRAAVCSEYFHNILVNILTFHTSLTFIKYSSGFPLLNISVIKELQ